MRQSTNEERLLRLQREAQPLDPCEAAGLSALHESQPVMDNQAVNSRIRLSQKTRLH